MHVVSGGIDTDVGQIADGIEKLSLRMDRANHRLRPAQWVRKPGLRESTHQGWIGSIEKHHRGRKNFSYLAEDRGEAIEMLSLAHVDDQRRTVDLRRLAHPVGNSR